MKSLKEFLENKNEELLVEYHKKNDKNKLTAICKDKIVYQSRGDAYDALTIAQKSKNLDSKKPTAFYECPVCKKWHLTSSAKEKTLFPQKGARKKNVNDFKEFKIKKDKTPLNIKTNLIDER